MKKTRKEKGVYIKVSKKELLIVVAATTLAVILLGNFATSHSSYEETSVRKADIQPQVEDTPQLLDEPLEIEPQQISDAAAATSSCGGACGSPTCGARTGGSCGCGGR